MPEENNPLADRIKKMAAVLAAAKKVGEDLEEEKEAKAQAETGQSAQAGSQRPS